MPEFVRLFSLIATMLLTCLACPSGMAQSAGATADDDGWIDLFNGRDLDGWTPKITHHAAGDNFGATFRVEDGLLKVRYDAYQQFAGRFGHLFYADSLSNYHLVVEYRFVGEQAPGGAGWAVRNSGVMLHAQSPASMELDQEFPVSIEAQFLGGLSNGQPRPTGNLCTPGTDVVYRGSLFTPHCLPSSSATLDGDQWVRAELIVRGPGTITHVINGTVVLEYSEPQLSAGAEQGDASARLLDSGFIALQSESHPLDFRSVRLRRLD